MTRYGQGWGYQPPSPPPPRVLPKDAYTPWADRLLGDYRAGGCAAAAAEAVFPAVLINTTKHLRRMQ